MTNKDYKDWENYLLSDDQMAQFIINGYMILETGVAPTINETIIKELNKLDSNPGDLITDSVPLLKEIYDHPKLRGALASLLGHDYKINTHRHCHKNPSGSRSQTWHQDSLDNIGFHKRNNEYITQLLVMYFPQNVDKTMGPTALIPGSHLLSNHNTDRTASQGNFRHQVTAELHAGSLLILHYDIWHAGTANTSGNIRYMVKFLYDRMSKPSEPSWDHHKANLFEITKILDSKRATGIQPSMGFKIKLNQRNMWNNLYGSNSAVEEYYDRFSGSWPKASNEATK